MTDSTQFQPDLMTKLNALKLNYFETMESNHKLDEDMQYIISVVHNAVLSDRRDLHRVMISLLCKLKMKGYNLPSNYEAEDYVIASLNSNKRARKAFKK